MKTFCDYERRTDIDELSRTVRNQGMGSNADPVAREMAEKARSGASRSGLSNHIRAFYERGNRPQPSLPRLKFLEGKD